MPSRAITTSHWAAVLLSASWMSRISPRLSSTKKIVLFLVSTGMMAIASSYWNREKEGCTFAQFGFNPDLSSVAFHNFLTDSQSHAGTGILIAGMQALENHKDAIGKLRIDANPVVLNREQPGIFLSLHSHMNPRCFVLLPKLNGVPQQVLEQLHQLGTVRHDGWHWIVANLSTRFGNSSPQIRECLVQRCLYLGQFPFNSFQVYLRVHQHIINQRLHETDTINGKADKLFGIFI